MVLTLQELVHLKPFAKTKKQKRLLLALCLASLVERPLIPDIRFDLGDTQDANTLLDFRFDIAGVQKLGLLLGLPTRFYDLTKTFGRSRSALSEIFLHVIDEIYNRWHGLLYFNTKLIQRNMDKYCQAIANKGSPISTIFAFIDGAKLGTCRISSTGNGQNLQRQIYSGHKRFHCLSYQALTAPDGICLHFFGPIEGRRHDTTLLRLSGLLAFIGRHPNIFNSRYIYGDPAYGTSKYILSGFKDATLSAEQQEFNKLMSRVRQSVEWNFKVMKSLWAFITYKNLSKIRLSPVAKIVCVAMLLTNCHCCHEGGNQISKYFEIDPPTLEEYLDTYLMK